jgi:hypothetical protein
MPPSTIRTKLIAPSSASRNRSAAIYRQPRAGDGERSRRLLLALAFFLAFPRTKRIAENASNATKATHNTSRTTSNTRSPCSKKRSHRNGNTSAVKKRD